MTFNSGSRRAVAMLFAALLIAGSGVTNVLAVEPGATPAAAIDLAAPEVQSSVRSSLYYMITAPFDGMLDITLSPIGGELDLAVIHVSGSPAIESRKEGEAREEISLRVVKGDRFLLRVISPFGRNVAFKLRAVVTAPASGGPAAQTFVPRVTGDGRTETTAVGIPIGQVIPIQAEGRRFFRVTVPKGAVLAVSLYPLHGDADLAVTLSGASKPAAISRRHGLFSEYVYIPVTSSGEALIAVTPSSQNPSVTGPLQYGVVARLKHSGVTATMADPESGDRDAVVRAFTDAPMGSGVPQRPSGAETEAGASGSRTGVLRLP
jgi:hypothetical protein